MALHGEVVHFLKTLLEVALLMEGDVSVAAARLHWFTHDGGGLNLVTTLLEQLLEVKVEKALLREISHVKTWPALALGSRTLG